MKIIFSVKVSQSKNNLAEAEENLILEQIKYLHQELISIQQAFLSVISIPLGIYGVMIYYAISLDDKGQILFILLPFLFSLSFYNVLKYTIKMLGLDAYVRHLESLINQQRKKPIFLWQSQLIYSNGYSLLGCIAQLPCLSAILIFLGVKYYNAIDKVELFPHGKTILTSLLIAQIICFALMTVASATQYYNVLNYCQSITYENMELLHTELPFQCQKLQKIK